MLIPASPPLDAPEALPPIVHRGRRFLAREVWLTGWRWLAEYRAAEDATDVLWADLPTSHGLHTPLTFDPKTNELLGNPSVTWWAEPLRRMFADARRTDSVVRVERRRETPAGGRQIFVNTLDFIFGHSLLILMNAQVYLERCPDAALVVVCTPEMRPFLPAETAEVWELEVESLAETQGWHQPLAERFARRCREAPVFIATTLSQPAPARYDLARFGLRPGTGGSDPAGAPRIVWTFRGSRFWGGSLGSERRRLARLGKHLRRLWPAARLEIHGFATLPASVPGWEDRTRRPGRGGDYNQRWTEELRTADLVLGAYGSNMLRPTAVSPRVIELVPLDKQPYVLQECLFDNSLPLREQFWRLRFLYGNGTLSDLAPRQVAHLIHSMLTMDGWFRLLQGGGFDDPDALSPARAAELYSGPVLAQTQLWQKHTAALERRSLASRFLQWLRRQASERD